MAEDGAYNALVSGITSVLFGTADIISGGNGKLPTAEDLESITTQAAEETASSIAANAAVLGGNTEAKSTDGNTRLTENDITEYVATGERQHVRNGKEAQIRTGDSPILTTPASIVGFIKDALTGKRRNVIKAYGRVGQRFSKDVYAKSEGITNISGYYMELDANKLAHMKDHLEVDEDLRNIPLTEDQLVHLPDYIDNYDDVVDVVRRKDGSVRIILGKKINGHTVIVETVSKGRKSVHPVTAYQIPTERYNSFYKTKAATTNTSQTASAAESGYKAITASVDNIPQVKNEVNGKTASEPSPFLYLGRLAEQAKKNGNLYTQRLLQKQIEKALKNFGKTEAETSVPLPTIYADYLRKHNMLDDYEAEAENSDGFEELIADLENDANSDTIKMNDREVRKWYVENVAHIPDGIDHSLPFEKQARMAFEARNKLRTNARNMMENIEKKEKLDKERPNHTFEELVESKMKRKGMTREEAIKDIYTTATKTNKNVNNKFGLGGE